LAAPSNAPLVRILETGYKPRTEEEPTMGKGNNSHRKETKKPKKDKDKPKPPPPRR
jgi:hypothetical protein